IRPNPRIRYEQTLLYTGLRTSRSADRPRPIVIFSNTIERSTLNYQFTRSLSLRTIVDYGAVIPNPSLVQLSRDKHLGVDVLLTYQVGPSAALYAGYTSAFQNLRVADRGVPVIPQAAPATQVGRQAIVKLSYL